MDRRDFIKISLSLSGLLPGLQSCAPSVPGLSITGANAELGHQLRDNHLFPEPISVTEQDIVIIGSGISGLSAARTLFQAGKKDFTILELEAHIGGNAAAGENKTSRFPLGAHYVPLPNTGLKDYLHFLEEAGIVTGYNEKGLPVYKETYLCQAPQERLYINGLWQDGLVPFHGVPEADQQQIKAFLQQMALYRSAIGTDGKYIFDIPIDQCSKDPEHLVLDNITFKYWLERNGWNSPYLHWYADYCTKDDFGTAYDEISAWMGIHYFASRKGQAANAQSSDVLTWPEGNNFLAQKLAAAFPADQVRKGCMVVRVLQQKHNKTAIDYYNTKEHKIHRIICKQCISAIPQFVFNKICPEKGRMYHTAQHMQYAPWMVATLNVSSNKLEDRRGQSMCWDNVIYNSSSLGYVTATHQQLQSYQDSYNLTYYLPLSGTDEKEMRHIALQRSKEEWAEIILNDLQIVHPNIKSCTNSIAIQVWGHAMCKPLMGKTWSGSRFILQQSICQRIHFAHTDLAGSSIFEEAFYQGIRAAEKVIKQLV